MAATASYSAVPSMLIVAPTGSTKRMIRRSMWLFSSRHLKVIGRVAELQMKNNLLLNIPNNISIGSQFYLNAKNCFEKVQDFNMNSNISHHILTVLDLFIQHYFQNTNRIHFTVIIPIFIIIISVEKADNDGVQIANCLTHDISPPVATVSLNATIWHIFILYANTYMMQLLQKKKTEVRHHVLNKWQMSVVLCFLGENIHHYALCVSVWVCIFLLSRCSVNCSTDRVSWQKG